MRVNFLGLFAVLLAFISLFLPWFSAAIFIEEANGYSIFHAYTSPIFSIDKLSRIKYDSYVYDNSGYTRWLDCREVIRRFLGGLSFREFLFEFIPFFLLLILIFGFHCCFYLKSWEMTTRRGVLAAGMFLVVVACLYASMVLETYNVWISAILITDDNITFHSFYLSAEEGLYIAAISVCLLIISGFRPITYNLRLRFVKKCATVHGLWRTLSRISEKEKLALIFLNSIVILEIFLAAVLSPILGGIVILFVSVTLFLLPRRLFTAPL